MFTSKIKASSCLGIGLAACVGAIAFQAPTRAQKVANISQVLVEASDFINLNLPMTLDPSVRWDSSSAGPGKIMNYNYTLLGYSADSIDGTLFARQFRPVVSSILCNESSSKIFRDNDVALKVNIYDNSQNLITRVQVTPTECR
ncbi:MAG: hypothetical protein AAFQ41_04725 [Cyanobacteria bacterium J06623_7]